jgi:hypothetical protein
MNNLLGPAILLVMLLASACSTIQLPVAEQEEEMSQTTPAEGKYTVDPRWEVGNWEVDYGGGD